MVDGEVGQAQALFHGFVEHQEKLLEFKRESEVADKLICLDFGHKRLFTAFLEFVDNKSEFVGEVRHGRALVGLHEFLKLRKDNDGAGPRETRSQALQVLATNVEDKVL